MRTFQRILADAKRISVCQRARNGQRLEKIHPTPRKKYEAFAGQVHHEHQPTKMLV